MKGLSFVSAGLLLAATMMAQQPGARDSKFMMKAAEGGMSEVQVGQLAQQKGSSDDVKKLGQTLVDDHTKANDQLKQLASTKGVTLPSAVEGKEKAELDRLSRLSGAEFDRAFVKHAIKDHQNDIKEFQQAASSASDPEVRNFANSQLPTLREHLRLAQEASSHMGGSSTGSADRMKQSNSSK